MMLCSSPAKNTLLLIFFALLVSACETLPGSGVADVNSTASPVPHAANKLAEIHTQLGIGYMREGNLEAAFDRLTRALQADPNFSTAHNAMGALTERLGNLDKAEIHYQTAVALNPSDSSAQSNYGSFLCRTGRYEEGEQRFLQALKNSLYSRPEIAYNNAGMCMQSADQVEKAETYFRSALERNSRIPSALIGMSKISFESKRYLPARAYLQRYQEIAQLDSSALWLGIRIERELGDKLTINQYSTRLRKQFPDSPETRELDSE